MTSQRMLALGLTVASSLTLLNAAQFGQGMRRSAAYEREMQNPAEDPPDAYQEAEFAFARLRYRSPQRSRGRGSWALAAERLPGQTPARLSGPWRLSDGGRLPRQL